MFRISKFTSAHALPTSLGGEGEKLRKSLRSAAQKLVKLEIGRAKAGNRPRTDGGQTALALYTLDCKQFPESSRSFVFFMRLNKILR